MSQAERVERTRGNQIQRDGLAMAVIGVVLLCGARKGHAAALAIGEGSATPGQAQVVLPVSLSIGAGEQLSALAFDVFVDPLSATWQSLALEPTLLAAGKQVQTNVIAPGHVRIVLYGMDRQVLSSGTIAQCVLQIPLSAPAGTSVINLQQGLAADPNGAEQLLALNDGRVWIDPPAASQAFQESNGQVVIEAEHFTSNISRNGKDWVSGAAQAGFSGSAYLEALPNTGVNQNTGYISASPELIYTVQFATAGTYFVWVRGYGDDDSDDSVHAGIDGTAPATADRITGFPVGWTWSRSTMDGVPATLTVSSPGLHTIHLWMREDGLIVDKLLLRTDSSSAAPSGNGPAESPQGGGAPVVDLTPPTIAGIVASSITADAVTIAWQTDELARTTLSIGTSAQYGTLVDGDTALSITHQAVVTGLTASTMYHFKITATDAAGNSTASSDQTALTAPLPDTTPPILSVTTPTNGATVAAGTPINVSGSASDDRAGLVVTVNGTSVSVAADGTFAYTIAGASSGSYVVIVQARDAAGNLTEVRRGMTIQAVTAEPAVTIVSPAQGSVLSSSTVKLVVNVANAQVGVGGIHLDVRLDKKSWKHYYTTDPVTFWAVFKGPHRITVRLVDGNHTQVPGANTEISTSFTVQ